MALHELSNLEGARSMSSAKGKEAEIVISSDDEQIEHDTRPVILRVVLSPSSRVCFSSARVADAKHTRVFECSQVWESTTIRPSSVVEQTDRKGNGPPSTPTQTTAPPGRKRTRFLPARPSVPACRRPSNESRTPQPRDAGSRATLTSRRCL
jgi:hypothetical protein